MAFNAGLMSSSARKEEGEKEKARAHARSKERPWERSRSPLFPVRFVRVLVQLAASARRKELSTPSKGYSHSVRLLGGLNGLVK